MRDEILVSQGLQHQVPGQHHRHQLPPHHCSQWGGFLPDCHHHHRFHLGLPLLPAQPCLDVWGKVEEERDGGEGSKLPPLFNFTLRRVFLTATRLPLPRRPRLSVSLLRRRAAPTTFIHPSSSPAGHPGRGRSLRPAEPCPPSTPLLSHSKPLLLALYSFPPISPPIFAPLQTALLPLGVSMSGLAPSEESRSPLSHLLPVNHPGSSRHLNGDRKHHHPPGVTRHPQLRYEDDAWRRACHPVQRLLPSRPPPSSQ